MAWTSKFVVYRKKDGSLEQVFASNDFKKAKYWIAYIAEVGDALFRTPVHPKHVDSKTPVYFCHKVGSGKTETNDKLWMEGLGENKLPEAEAVAAEE